MTAPALSEVEAARFLDFETANNPLDERPVLMAVRLILDVADAVGAYGDNAPRYAWNLFPPDETGWQLRAQWLAHLIPQVRAYVAPYPRPAANVEAAVHLLAWAYPGCVTDNWSGPVRVEGP